MTGGNLVHREKPNEFGRAVEVPSASVGMRSYAQFQKQSDHIDYQLQENNRRSSQSGGILLQGEPENSGGPKKKNIENN